MKRILFVIAVLLMTVTSVTKAQRYEVDLLFEDSVECDAAMWRDSVWVDTSKEPGIVLRSGEVIDSFGVSHTRAFVTFERDGKKYIISKSYLKFCDDNPEGTVNPLSDSQRRAHSAIGHFFATMTPAYAVVGLLLLAFILAMLSVHLDIPGLRQIAVIGIPVCILLVALLEIAAYYFLGSNAFWWCSYDRHGFFGSLLRVIPFGLVVFAQMASIRLFEMVLFHDEPEYSDKSISVKPAAIGLGACIPVTIVYFIITQAALDWRGPLSEGIGVVLFFATFIIGILITAKRNIQTMGPKLGIPVTVFTIIYIIGCVIALFAVLVVLIQLIIQVLMVVFGVIVLSMVMQKRRFRGSDGRIYEEI